jgi:hypothetical protein
MPDLCNLPNCSLVLVVASEHGVPLPVWVFLALLLLQTELFSWKEVLVRVVVTSVVLVVSLEFVVVAELVLEMVWAEEMCALVARVALTIDRELGESFWQVSPQLGFLGQYLAKCPGQVVLLELECRGRGSGPNNG